MKVTELTRDQLVELKEKYLVDWYDRLGQCPSWEELASADSTVADYVIFDIYAGIDFVPDDFSCTAGN